jgi:predicted O-methyltransferase YrrM
MKRPPKSRPAGVKSPHRHVFARLVAQQGYRVGVELGVDKGILFGTLLREIPQLTLTGVDLFPDRHRSRKAFASADRFSDRARLLIESTHTAHRHFEDGSLDFVFIDADHTYEGASQDIRLWRPKVRPGGWCGGHDYCQRFPGVIQAVKEAFPLGVREWPGDIWGVFL